MEENKKNNETEEEMRERLKKEIMAELREEMKKENEETSDSPREEKKPVQRMVNPQLDSSSKIKYKENASQGVHIVNEMDKKEQMPHRKEEPKKDLDLPKAKEGGNKSVTVVILLASLVVMVAMIFFLQKDIYRFFFQKTTPSHYSNSSVNSNSNTNGQPLKEITLESEVLNRLVYPIMRNNPYGKETYYTKSSFTMSDLKNNDILYNAFLQIPDNEFFISTYTGSYNAEYCGTESQKKMVSERYIDTRIANTYSKDTEYKHETFVVPPTTSNTKYVGTWQYDAKNKRYIYYGNCGTTPTGNITYYDLKNTYQVKGLENNTIIKLWNYIGFAKVDHTTKQYTLFKDAAMSEVLQNGTLTTNNYQQELEEIWKTYSSENSSQLSSYIYEFSTINCAYGGVGEGEYCFVEGSWSE